MTSIGNEPFVANFGETQLRSLTEAESERQIEFCYQCLTCRQAFWSVKISRRADMRCERCRSQK